MAAANRAASMANMSDKDPEQWTITEILAEEKDINSATKALKRYLRNYVKACVILPAGSVRN